MELYVLGHATLRNPSELAANAWRKVIAAGAGDGAPHHEPATLAAGSDADAGPPATLAAASAAGDGPPPAAGEGPTRNEMHEAPAMSLDLSPKRSDEPAPQRRRLEWLSVRIQEQYRLRE